MSLLDKFRKKDKEQKPKEKIKREISDVQEKVGEKEKEVTMTAPQTSDAKSYGVIKEPVITEKATHLNSFNKYVFKVYPDANKLMVKNAIEKLYKGVEVKDIRIINVRGKQRRLGRFEGFKPGYKKAIVTLKKGKIELAPLQ